MPKRLSEAQVAQYRDQGYTFPVDVFTPQEVARYRASLEEFEAEQGRSLWGAQKSKCYLLFDWAHEMITHSNVLDAVEDVIGPDILAFYSTAWFKEPGAPHFVSWHQDATYFGLEPAEQVTAWMALSPSTPESGCVSVLPATHKDGLLDCHNDPEDTNLLTSGQNVDLEIDFSRTVDMVLSPGQMSLHHTHAVHGSNPNRSTERRLGLCVHYIPTSVCQVGDCHSTALLVRGVDSYGNFALETPPQGNADSAAVAAHAEALRLFRANAEEQGNPTGNRHD